MTDTSKRDKTIALALMGAYAVTSIVLVIVQYARGESFFAVRGLLFPLFLLIPPLFKLLKLNQPWRLHILLYLFILFAFCYGSIWGAFKTNLVIDKVSHFFSGLLFTILGFCIYGALAGPARDDLRARHLVAAGWALFFSTFVAVLWEVLEFCDYMFLGNDSQNHETTGVFDTMYDLIFCLIASVLSALAYLLWRKKGIKLLTGWVVEEFWAVNGGS